MRMAISNVVMMKLMMMKVMPMPILSRSALAELKNKFNRSAASSDITINRKVSFHFTSDQIHVIEQISPLWVVFMFSFSLAGELQVSQMRERVQVHDPVERPHSFQARMLAPSTTTGFPRTENKDNLLWESSQLKSYLLMMC